MRFEQYQQMLAAAQERIAHGGAVPEVAQLSPVALAYIGDAVFSLYVRERLLSAAGPIRILHALAAQIVSAKWQAQTLEALLGALTAEELAVLQRGRNAKSTPPKNADPQEYRQATALEALLGWLYLQGNPTRLAELLALAWADVQSRL